MLLLEKTVYCSLCNFPSYEGSKVKICCIKKKESINKEETDYSLFFESWQNITRKCNACGRVSTYNYVTELRQKYNTHTLKYLHSNYRVLSL